jgi:hypothetical protein
MPNAVLAILCLAVLVPPAAFAAPDGPPAPDGPSASAPAQVTTDTAAFCAELAAKMDQESDASFDAVALGAQGKQLCANGEYRAGVSRLRRALLSARDDGYDDEVTVPSAGGGATRPSPPSVGFPGFPDSDGPEGGAVTFPNPPGGMPNGPLGGPPGGMPPPPMGGGPPHGGFSGR